MRDTARLAAMDDPEENPAFLRGRSWNVPDRLPTQRPPCPHLATLDLIAIELAIIARAA